MRDRQEDTDIERAIVYLVTSFEASGANPKPVVLHSVRVGMDLYNRGYEKQIVIAGFLHDLIEDTDVTRDDIAAHFGAEVAAIVAATSFDRAIEDYTERYRDTFDRCVEMGRPPVLVKAADTLDNSSYYHLADSKESRANLVEKLASFIDRSEPYIGEERLHEELQDSYAAVVAACDSVDE
ncbi:HD domain-containing protein [Halorhabdus sp. CBA1104]|uniref:HD domain-containing protein n=1 Tax=Halorhabdus sp. CBA1104 TaxID=1380432 RepID=UPI0012B3922E|nr:HD domain-containing protein [Halorhabdus sp. CBA1104]QGN06907.1 HD domain-containing protein [Halorhabdus sp. CBA1104]